MQHWKVWLTIIAVLSIVIIGAVSGSAQTQTEVITVAPQNVAIGETFNADVYINNVANLGMVYFFLQYDPTTIEYVDIQPGSVGGVTARIDTVAQLTNEILVVVYFDTPASGFGDIVNITFNAHAPGHNEFWYRYKGMFAGGMLQTINADWYSLEQSIGSGYTYRWQPIEDTVTRDMVESTTGYQVDELIINPVDNSIEIIFITQPSTSSLEQLDISMPAHVRQDGSSVRARIERLEQQIAELQQAIP